MGSMNGSVKAKEEIQIDQTAGINFVTFHINNNNFDIWDLGGDVVHSVLHWHYKRGDIWESASWLVKNFKRRGVEAEQDISGV